MSIYPIHLNSLVKFKHAQSICLHKSQRKHQNGEIKMQIIQIIHKGLCLGHKSNLKMCFIVNTGKKAMQGEFETEESAIESHDQTNRPSTQSERSCAAKEKATRSTRVENNRSTTAIVGIVLPIQHAIRSAVSHFGRHQFRALQHQK